MQNLSKIKMGLDLLSKAVKVATSGNLPDQSSLVINGEHMLTETQEPYSLMRVIQILDDYGNVITIRGKTKEDVFLQAVERLTQGL